MKKSIIRKTLAITILFLVFASNAFAVYGTLISSSMSRYDPIAQGQVVDCTYSTMYGNYQITLKGYYCPSTYTF